MNLKPSFKSLFIPNLILPFLSLILNDLLAPLNLHCFLLALLLPHPSIEFPFLPSLLLLSLNSLLFDSLSQIPLGTTFLPLALSFTLLFSISHSLSISLHSHYKKLLFILNLLFSLYFLISLSDSFSFYSLLAWIPSTLLSQTLLLIIFHPFQKFRAYLSFPNSSSI